jgi:hypothetical protein
MSLKTQPGVPSFPRAEEEKDEDNGTQDRRRDRHGIEEDGHR